MSTFTFEVTESNFQTQVLQSDVPVLVDFWAEWCPPCKMIEPNVQEIARKYQGKLAVGRLDVDAYPQLQNMFDVAGIPTLILFQGGKPVRRLVGFRPKDKLEAEVLACLR